MVIVLDIPSLVTLYLGKNCFGNIPSDISIDNFNNLTQLELEDTAFQKANSLKICNNDKLETIQIICNQNIPNQNQRGYRNAFQPNNNYPPTPKHVLFDST